MSRWLNEASAGPNGLRFAGVPARKAATLLLEPDGARISSKDAEAALAWESYGMPPSLLLTMGARGRREGANGWWISWWRHGRNSSSGLGIYASGTSLETLEATDLVPHRYALLDSERADVPLYRQPLWRFVAASERQLLDVIGRLLRARPQLRPRLLDEGRMEKLLRDALAFDPTLRMGTPTFLRRQDTEIATAMHLLGYEHEFGRPIGGDHVDDAETIVGRVRDRIAANPFAAHVRIDDSRVWKIVTRNYLNVDPWPLDALVGDA